LFSSNLVWHHRPTPGSHILLGLLHVRASRVSPAVVYDGDGNRVSETVGTTTTKYLIDTLNPTGYSQVLDELVNGAVTKTYTYGLQRISENQLSGSMWTPTFYGYDGHGNVRFMTSSTGTVGNTGPPNYLPASNAVREIVEYASSPKNHEARQTPSHYGHGSQTGSNCLPHAWHQGIVQRERLSPLRRRGPETR
jgi:hypothetical protein